MVVGRRWRMETRLAYDDLRDWIQALDKAGELQRVREEVDPVLEIAEVTDRASKSGKIGGPNGQSGRLLPRWPRPAI